MIYYGKTFKKTTEINYCVICRKFYTNFCDCSQNSLNSLSAEVALNPATHFPQLNVLNSIKQILYIVIATVYSYAKKLIRSKNAKLCVLVKETQDFLKKNTLKGFHNIKYKQNLCSNYIYLLSNEDCIYVKPNCNFYVYMMSAHLEKEDETINQQEPPSNPVENTPRTDISEYASLSSSSLGSKKSIRSGMLHKISKTLKRKKKHEELENGDVNPTSTNSKNTLKGTGDPHIIHPSTSKETPQRLRPKSKIPILKLKVKDKNATTTKNEESQDLLDPMPAHKPKSFFQKLVKKQSSYVNEEHNASCEKASPSNPELFVNEQRPKSQSCLKIEEPNFPQKMNEIGEYCRSCSSHVFPQIQPQFQAQSNLNLRLNLNNDLQEVIELAQRLQESESHLTHIISKYVQDRNFEKELLSVLTNHAKLHIEAERRTQNLAHEMWLQQIEMLKAQEITTQENLNAVMKQNKQLQEEVENLSRKNEKLCTATARQYSDYTRLPLDSNSQLIENLTTNNDKLRYKISALSAQTEEQEKEFQVFQRKNQLVEQQLRNSNSQLHNYKAMLQRIQTDNELEHANLSHQLQVNQMTIKESAEAGDVLLEDLDALKRQLKSMPCTLNWTKFKSRGNSLPDLIYMCRSCINELAKELLNSQTEIILREKDNNGLKEEIKRIEETLSISKSEHERMHNQLKMCKIHESDLKQYMAKCGSLERELGEYKQHMERVVSEFEKEKVSLIASVDDMDNLSKKVIEKDEELILNKEKMSEYKSENDTLRMQLHGLKQVLAASGSGDVARELADSHEKMAFFQSQYYQLLSEKNYLIEQLQTANMERGTLNQFQNNYYQFIQVQQQDLELLNRDNLVLREQLEKQRDQISTLKMERGKLKEEKNIMRQIYHQLKNEINRVQQLQGEVTGMNIEANRLAIIAEYNKQLGEKLQCEVVERDEKIYQLQTNMEKLNNAQIENTKDKVALCVELTEVCTINDHLNNSLVAEHQKSANLDESKKKLENSANTQLKAIEEMQKVERAALKELLKDYNNVVTQRDNLVISQNEYLQQISDLRANAVIQARNIESASEKCMQATENIENLQNKLKKSEKELEKVRGVVGEKENTHKRIEDELQQLKSQKENLESTKTYLQNTIQKLHNDLNESRKAELEIKQLLKKEIKKTEILQFAFDQNRAALIQLSQQNQTLTQEATNLNAAYEKLLTDNKEHVEKATKTEEELKKELSEAKEFVEKTSMEVKRIEGIIAEKDLEQIEVQEYCKNLVEQLKQLESTTEDIDCQSKLLSENNLALVKLQNAYTSLQVDHERCTETISELRKEKQKLQDELKTHLDETDASYVQYKGYIDEIIKEHNDQKEEMQADLKMLSVKFQDVKNNCANEKDAHDKLLEAHKDLAAKLLKAVRMLIDEKLHRQGAEASVASCSQEILRLSSEKTATENTLSLISNELEDLKTRVGDLTTDKKSLQAVLSDMQELYKRSQFRCRLSEQQLQDAKRIKRSPSVRSSKAFTLNETKSKLQFTEERTKSLKEDLEKSHKTIMDLKTDISNLQQELTVMEFQKCEVALRLHETEAKLKTEQNMNVELVEMNQQIVEEVIKMKREGIITSRVPETLFELVRGRTGSAVLNEIETNNN